MGRASLAVAAAAERERTELRVRATIFVPPVRGDYGDGRAVVTVWTNGSRAYAPASARAVVRDHAACVPVDLVVPLVAASASAHDGSSSTGALAELLERTVGPVLGVSVSVPTHPDAARVSGSRIKEVQYMLGNSWVRLADLLPSAAERAAGVHEPVRVVELVDTNTRQAGGGAAYVEPVLTGMCRLRVRAADAGARALMGASASSASAAGLRTISASLTRAHDMAMADFAANSRTRTGIVPGVMQTQSLYNTTVAGSLPASTYVIPRIVHDPSSARAEAAFLRQGLTVAAMESGFASPVQFIGALRGKHGPAASVLAMSSIVRFTTHLPLSVPYTSDKAAVVESAAVGVRKSGTPADSAPATGEATSARAVVAARLRASGADKWVPRAQAAALADTYARGIELRISRTRDHFENNLFASALADCEDGGLASYLIGRVLADAGRALRTPGGAGGRQPLYTLVRADPLLRESAVAMDALLVASVEFYSAASASASGKVAADKGGGGAADAASVTLMSHQASAWHFVPEFVRMLEGPRGGGAAGAALAPQLVRASERAMAHLRGIGTPAEQFPSTLFAETTGASVGEVWAPAAFVHSRPEDTRAYVNHVINKSRFMRAVADVSPRLLALLHTHPEPGMSDAPTAGVLLMPSAGPAGLPLQNFKRYATSTMTNWVSETTGDPDAPRKYNYVKGPTGLLFGTSVTELAISGMPRVPRGALYTSKTLSAARENADAGHSDVALVPADNEGRALGRRAGLPRDVGALVQLNSPVQMPWLRPEHVGVSGVPAPTSDLFGVHGAMAREQFGARSELADDRVPATAHMRPGSDGYTRGRVIFWLSDRSVPPADELAGLLRRLRDAADVLASRHGVRFTGMRVHYVVLCDSPFGGPDAGGVERLYVILHWAITGRSGTRAADAEFPVPWLSPDDAPQPPPPPA